MPIEVINAAYCYDQNQGGKVSALKGVSFRAEDGEWIGIMGQTGCGKSTLIQLLAGLLTPSGGRVLINQEDINGPGYDRAVLRKTVGIVFQYPEYQLFETTVERDVAFSLKHSGLNRREITQQVRWALEAVGFSYEEIRKKSPMSLSGGEKRRAAIAGVLAARPQILIFDEPLAGLDPAGREAFLELAARMNRAGTTIFMVSHNADLLCEYAGRILVLEDGRLAADGTPEEVFCSEESAAALKIGPCQVQCIAQRLYEKGILPSPSVTKRRILEEQIMQALGKGAGVLEGCRQADMRMDSQ